MFIVLISHVNSNLVDCDKRVIGRYRHVEEAEVVIHVVVASQIVPCGGRYDHRKVTASVTDTGAANTGVVVEDRTVKVMKVKRRGR